MPVCIAGMHRSGTSMVTKHLHDCGLYLGRNEDLMPPAAENPEGFWEHLPLVAVNDDILNRLGGGWDCPPPEPTAEQWRGALLAPARTRAATIVAHFEGREPWGWKDPRSSITLPFWRALLPGLRTVVVVRNPLEVALSLQRRNGFSFALGLTLWHIYYRRLLDAAPAADRLITHYDAYFAETEPEVRRLAAFAQLPVDEDRLATLRASAELRHHRLTADDLVDAAVSPAIFELYRDLCLEAGWRDTDEARVRPTAPASREGAAGEPSGGQISPLAAGVGGISGATIEAGVLRQELARHREALDRREERIAELEAAIAEHERARVQIEGDLAAKESQIAQLGTVIAEGERQIQERNGKIEERDGRVAERDARLQIWGRERHVMERDLAALRQTVADQERHLRLSEQQVETMVRHEAELRAQLVSLHEQLLHKDAEVMATLGAALARHAPNAPAGAYYRHLLRRVRTIVERLPAGAAVAVVSLGDDEMLRFAGRQAWHFPSMTGDLTGGFKTIVASAAMAQIELLEIRGARFLVAPSPGQSWLARHPDVARALDERYQKVIDEPGVVAVYELADPTSQGTVADRPAATDAEGQRLAGVAA